MTTETETGNGTLQARRALWASSVFYVLIAFEFFYMASPFAAYFYAVYGPGLVDFLYTKQSTKAARIDQIACSRRFSGGGALNHGC